MATDSFQAAWGEWGAGLSWGNASTPDIEQNPVITTDPFLGSSHLDIGLRFSGISVARIVHSGRIVMPPIIRGPNQGLVSQYNYWHDIYLYMDPNPSPGALATLSSDLRTHDPGSAGATAELDDTWLLVSTLELTAAPQPGDVWIFPLNLSLLVSQVTKGGWNGSLNFLIADPGFDVFNDTIFFDPITNPHPNTSVPIAAWAAPNPRPVLELIGLTTQDEASTVRRMAKGTPYWMCPRCGVEVRRSELARDGEKPDLYVCWECRDKPGAKKTARALRREREPRMWPRI